MCRAFLIPSISACCASHNAFVTVQGSQFAIGDVEVVTATVDLDEVVSYRGAVSSLQEQASSASPVPTVYVDFNLCHPARKAAVPSAPIEPRYHVPEEEIALGRSLNLLIGIVTRPAEESHTSGAVGNLQEQASITFRAPTALLGFDLCHTAEKAVVPSAPIGPQHHVPERDLPLVSPKICLVRLLKSGHNHAAFLPCL